MRKKLEWATADLEMQKLSTLSLSLKPVKEILNIIYRKRGEYIRKMHREPKGIVLPIRIFIVMEMHRNDFMHEMQIDHERRATLFGLEVQPHTGTSFSFIPHPDDVMFMAHMEEVDNERD